MTPRYFAAVHKAYAESEKRKFEMARLMVFWQITGPQSRKKKISVKDIATFPWEKTDAVFDQQSDEEKALIKERHRILLERRRAQRQTVNGVS